jgi:hypothetical protein
VLVIFVARLALKFADVKEQLTMLGVLNVCLIALILIEKPFEDGTGNEKLGSADKAELIALLSQLLNYAVGALCALRWARPAATQRLPRGNRTADRPGRAATSKRARMVLRKDKEFLATTLTMLCLIMPLAYVVLRSKWLRCKCKRDTTSQEEERDKEDAATMVTYDNPIHTTDIASRG